MDEFIQTNGIDLHYLRFPGTGPTVVLMHGLTANAHAFDGLISAGLNTSCEVISIDLRGRGQSEQPEDYSMAAHAGDIIGLLDGLGIKKAILGGHSFGALLSLYLAFHFPDRVEKLVILDAAARMHERTKEMLGPALGRLGQTYPSFEAYIEKVKSAPYLTFWDEAMLSYYRADVEEAQNGTVRCIPQLTYMLRAVNGVLEEPWLEYLETITQPAVLVNGPGVYTMEAPLLPKDNALETVRMMRACVYVEVPGNHQTMLYGEGAKAICRVIHEFLNGVSPVRELDKA
jgi:pimeloyl-ACP methyl ester carboxylesterase